MSTTIFPAERVTRHRSMNETLTVKRKKPPVRCEVCHRSDKFNPETGVCQRCSPTIADVGRKGGPTGTQDIPQEFQKVFSEIVGGEEVLWVGRPDLDTARRRGVGMYLFACLIGFVGAVFFIAAVVSNYRSWTGVDSSLLLRIVFMLLPLLISGFWCLKIGRRQRAIDRTLYVLTKRRALILTKNAVEKSFQLNPDKLWAGSFNIPENPRIGGVIFEKRWKIFQTPYDWDQFKVGYRRYGVGFLCIEDFREVERLVRKHAKSKKTR